MGEAEFIGMLVIALATLIGIVVAIGKPLSDNTKAMTTLTLNINHLSEKLDTMDKEFKAHKQEFEKYKEHVTDSQKRQWDDINKNTDDIKEVQHKIELLHPEGR